MWNSGRTPYTTSSGPIRSLSVERIWPRLASRLPWVSIAAAEAPAVPLVNISTARVSPSTSTGGTGAVVSSSSKVCAPSRSWPGVATTETIAPVTDGWTRLPRGRGHRPDHRGDRRDLRQLPLDLRRRAGRVEGHGDGAQPDGGQEGDDEVRVVAAQDGDAVAGADAEVLRARRGTPPSCSRSAPYVVVRVWLTSAGASSGWSSRIDARFTWRPVGAARGRPAAHPPPGAAAPGCYPAGRSGHEAVRPVRRSAHARAQPMKTRLATPATTITTSSRASASVVAGRTGRDPIRAAGRGPGAPPAP